MDHPQHPDFAGQTRAWGCTRPCQGLNRKSAVRRPQSLQALIGLKLVAAMSRVVNFTPSLPRAKSSWIIKLDGASVSRQRYADQRRFFHADFSTRLIPVIVPANWCLRENVCSTSINKAVWFRCAACLLVVKRTDYSLAINWDAFVVMQRWLKRARLLWFYGKTNLRFWFWKYV